MNIILYVIDCGVTMNTYVGFLLYLKYCKPPFGIWTNWSFCIQVLS